MNGEKDVCCIASTQTNAERLMNTAPTLSRDKDRTIASYNSFCLAGNFVDRNTGQNGRGVRENASFTLNTQDRHAVAYDARNSRLNGTMSGTLQAKESGGWSLNYCHFPAAEDAGYDENYFKMLTAEHKVTRWKGGRKVERWELKDPAQKRNEAFDVRNYATAALEISNPQGLEVPGEETARPAKQQHQYRRRRSRGI